MSLAPPFTEASAHAKVKKAQDLWNTQCPEKIAQAYTPDSIWRSRSSFIKGTAAIEELLTKKWEKEKNYRLRKELFAFSHDKIAVQFWYEFQDAHDGLKWKRCYGLEDWTFAEDGKMRKRHMSGNDIEISEAGKFSFAPNGHPIVERTQDGATNRIPSTVSDSDIDRWFKDGVDVNDVEIGEAHW